MLIGRANFHGFITIPNVTLYIAILVWLHRRKETSLFQAIQNLHLWK